MCVLFAVCLIHARQDSPGERRSGVLGKQLQPSHCINKGTSTDFWLVSSSTAPWIWQILLIAFAHVFIFGFVFPLLCSSSKFHRRKHTAVTPQELHRRQRPLEPPLPPTVLMQACTKSLSFIPWPNWFPKALVNYNQQLSDCGCSVDKDISENINKIQNNIQNYSPQKFCVALVGDKNLWTGRKNCF